MPDPEVHLVDPTDSSDWAQLPIAVVENHSALSGTLDIGGVVIDGGGDGIHVEMAVPPQSTAFIGARLRFGPETPTSPVTIEKMTAAPGGDVESGALAVDISLGTEGADPVAFGWTIRSAIADITAPDGPLTNETESAWFTETFSTRTTLSMRLGFRFESDSGREDSDAPLDDGTIMPRLGFAYELGAERVRVRQQLDYDDSP